MTDYADDSRYPTEWIIVGSDPICTAFGPEKTAEERKEEKLIAQRKKLEEQGQMRLF